VRTADFDYPLPETAIAQQARPRGTSRLLVLDRARGANALDRISSLPRDCGPATCCSSTR